MASKMEERKDMLSAEVLSFSKNTDENVFADASSSARSRESGRVKIQRIDEERHHIIVLNESSEVMTSYAVDNIAQLHHIEEDNVVKWSGMDVDSDTWSLTLKDKTIASNFVRMVGKVSKLSLHAASTETNKTVYMYSSITKTEFVLPEEKSIPSSRTIQAAPVKPKSFTGPPTSSSSNSVFEYTEATLSQSGMFNINEPMSSENDIDADSVVPKPKAPTKDTDEEVPLSPIVTIDDHRLHRSSTPTTEYLSNVDLHQEILSRTSATNKDLISKSACVVGMTENIGMIQNEQDSTKRKKPDNLQGISGPQPGYGTPLTDLSAGSEMSTLSRGGACFFNNSHGTDDEGYQMELDDSYDRYYQKMVDCYKKTLTYHWSKHSTSDSSKIHKVIAALICQNGKHCYAAILSTGTYYNDTEKCGSTSTCDGHAVSICYEAAPKYFLKEIKSLKNGDDSIFECIPNKEGYRLKAGISFHLFVTQFPCGFIQDQKEPCMEWKVPFVEYPHVPTCSSRILIGATMGIQGYISHLLDKPIMIDSLVILCADIDSYQIPDFGNSFPMPKIIKIMKYDPDDFKPGFFLPSKPILWKYQTKYEHQYVSYESAESTDGNETAKSVGSSLERAKDSSVIVATPDRSERIGFLKFDPRTTKQTSSHSDFSINTKDIDQGFEVDEGLKIQRISYLKQLYENLANRLKLEEALQILSNKLDAESRSKEEAMSSLIQSISTELTVVPNTLDTSTMSVQEWDNYIQKQVESKIHNMREEGRTKIRNQQMIMCIQELLAKKGEKIIMDCNWHQYLYAIPSSFQPTSDE